MKPHLAKPDDGSTLVEWIDKDRRFGLSFEKDGTACWWFVDREFSDSGELPSEIVNALALVFVHRAAHKQPIWRTTRGMK